MKKYKITIAILLVLFAVETFCFLAVRDTAIVLRNTNEGVASSTSSTMKENKFLVDLNQQLIDKAQDILDKNKELAEQNTKLVEYNKNLTSAIKQYCPSIASKLIN